MYEDTRSKVGGRKHVTYRSRSYNFYLLRLYFLGTFLLKYLLECIPMYSLIFFEFLRSSQEEIHDKDLIRENKSLRYYPCFVKIEELSSFVMSNQ